MRPAPSSPSDGVVDDQVQEHSYHSSSSSTGEKERGGLSGAAVENKFNEAVRAEVVKIAQENAFAAVELRDRISGAGEDSLESQLSGEYNALSKNDLL